MGFHPTANNTIKNLQAVLDSSTSLTETDDAVWHLFGKINGSEAPRKVLLNQLPFQIGRQVESALSLGFPTISGLHAEISMLGLRLMLTDLGSTNGTFVNGNPVDRPTPIKEGT